ncbi:hypothetical protein BSP109_02158 [Brevibacterium sp. Mu109]|nr:hypothetical protein BSP109_02158 [Brevibacterium sp. Mu109]
MAGVVEFTESGQAALDTLARTLTAHYDGTPESITQMLEEVLGADVAELAQHMTEVAHACGIIPDDPSHTGERSPGLDMPIAESPTGAARRRLAQSTRASAAGPASSSHGVRR